MDLTKIVRNSDTYIYFLTWWDLFQLNGNGIVIQRKKFSSYVGELFGVIYDLSRIAISENLNTRGNATSFHSRNAS